MHATTWMNFENVMLNERSQTQKTIYCKPPFTQTSRKDKIKVSQSRSTLPASRGIQRQGTDCKGVEGNFI